MSDTSGRSDAGGSASDAGGGGGLLSWAIARPVSVAAAVILVVVFGVLSIFRLPIQLTPDITRPTISVTTRWPGSAPVEVESELLEPQEKYLRRVNGLVRMESTARPGSGAITLEFEAGANLEEALVRVANQLGQVPRYPADADQPIISTSSDSGPPLAVILVRRPEGGSVAAYRTWIDETILPRIERIPGVASIFERGGQVTEVHIDFDPEAVAGRGLAIPDLAARVRRELRNVSAGDVVIGKRNLLVRTLVTAEGHPGNPAAGLGQMVIGIAPDGTATRLSDVAHVHLGLREATDVAIGNDRAAIAILPRREAGSNVLEVTREIRRTVAELNRDEFAPEGLEIEVVDDQSSYIEGSLTQVGFNLALGGVLATVVLLVFLGSGWSAGLVSLAIPVCVLGTGLFMTLLGRSINVVSLAGITFAVGMVVDNSIVSLENIDTWLRREPRPRVAAFRATREVWGALLASTATTAAVFLPILGWQGEVGQVIADVAYAVAIAVVLSFLVSVFVIPSFAAVAIRAREGKPSRIGARLRGAVEGTVAALARNTATALVVAGGAIASAVVVAVLLLPRMEYLPTGNRNLIFGLVLPPPGLSVPELERLGAKNQAVMMEHTGKAVGGWPSVHRSFFVGDPGLLIIGAVASDPDDLDALKARLRALHSEIPGSIGFAARASLFASGIGEERAIKVELTGDDLNDLISTGRTLFGELKEALPDAQVRPVPVLDLGAPEVHLVPRRRDALAAGFGADEVATIAAAHVDGARLGEFGAEGQRKVDVVLRARTPAKNDLELAAVPVATRRGTVVPLGTLAAVERRLGPTVVKRIERSRAVELQVTPSRDTALEAALATVNERLASLRERGAIPRGVSVAIGGNGGRLAQAQLQFAGVLALAVLITYLLLAGLFEDFLAPLVILITVPLAGAGGVLALRLVDLTLGRQPLDLMTALGFLILIGVVVNNAILIVDGALARVREGATIEEAAASAAGSRTRAIFMSSLTSLAGLAPMVIVGGTGSELYRGIGTIVLGGLALSTVLSLFVVPSTWVVLERLRAAVGLVVPTNDDRSPSAAE